MKKRTLIKQLSVVSLALAFAAGSALPQASAAAPKKNFKPHVSIKNVKSGAAPATHTPAFISPKLSTDSSNLVSVIVQLSGDPVAVTQFSANKQGLTAFSAESAEAVVNQEQTAFVSSAKGLGINLNVNYQYNTVLNGLEVTLPANKIPELAKLQGVKSVHENAEYFPIPVGTQAAADTAGTPNYDSAPLKQIGADAAWSKGFTGKGLKVGVIDTGVDYLHPDLKGAYKGGYDSFQKDNDPYEEPPLSPQEDPLGAGFAGTYHGTHVSGTIVGRGVNPTSSIVQKGVAYEADLYVYKVLGRKPGSSSSSGSSAQVIDGIEHAVKDRVNVINLSLGSASEKDVNSPDVIAVNNAVLGGITAVLSNGNAADGGHYYYSLGSPAVSPLAISVGAVTSPTKNYSATVTEATYGGSTGASHALNVAAWKTGQDNFAAQFGTQPQDVVYVDLGQPDDYVGKNVAGKIALVSRGSLAFSEKIANAKANGAKGIILFNGNVQSTNPNEADLSDSIPARDGYIGLNLGDGFDYITTFDLKGTEGRALARKALAAPGQTLKLAFGPNYPIVETKGDTLAAFSSRGPNVDNELSIKPDISAPGVNVLSTWPAYGKQRPGASYDAAYNRISGTSMAAPHIAGLALLLKQQHPDWTPFEIRAALANTADTIQDESGTQYDVYSQGAGRANVSKAIETPALLQSVDPITILDKFWKPQAVTNYGSSVSFGVLEAGSNGQKELQLKNKSSQSLSYTAKVVLHPQVTSDPSAPIPTPDVNNLNVELVGLSQGDKVNVAKGEAKSFYLSVTPKATAVKGVYEGEVVLQSPGRPKLHLPFVVHVGTEKPDTGFGVQEIEQTETAIYPESSTLPKTTDLSLRLSAKNVNTISLWAIGLDDEYIGLIDEITNEDATGRLQLLAPGRYTFENIDGTYYDGEVDADSNPIAKKLGDGTYKLEVLAQQLDKNGSVVNDITYKGYSSLKIASPEKERVAQAADSFQAKIINKTTLNKAVLQLPTTEGIQYKVTFSNNKAYIDNNGILKLVPKQGLVNVELTVTISSVAEPTVKTTVKVPVALGKAKVAVLTGAEAGSF